MNAFDWTKPMEGDNAPSTFRFSFNQRGLAADLRRLADALDAEQVIAFEVSTTSKVVRDNWTGTVVSMTLTGVHGVGS